MKDRQRMSAAQPGARSTTVRRGSFLMIVLLGAVAAIAVTRCHRDTVSSKDTETAGASGAPDTDGVSAGGALGASGGGGRLAASDSRVDGASDENVCGGATGRGCGPMQWCSFSRGDCGAGNRAGQCRAIGDMNGVECTSPVCGCNGQAYCNAWNAHVAGTDTTDSKSCVTGNGVVGATCWADGDCQNGFKCCRASGGGGTPLVCKQAMSGYCPAVP